MSLASSAPVLVIIGHLGRMGNMLAALWEEVGYHVRGVDQSVLAQVDPCDRNHASSLPQNVHLSGANTLICVDELAKAIRGADLIVLCVPISVMQNLLSILCPLLNGREILIDIASVKTLPMQYMQAAYSGPIIGTHPLFGPAAHPNELKVVVTPGQNASYANIRCVEGLFTAIGCKIIHSTPEEHDKGVAFAQSLNFATNAMFFATVANQVDIFPFLTPSFFRRLEAARKQLTDDADMFIGINCFNPQMPSALKAFRRALEQVEEGGLEQLVRKAQSWYLEQDEGYLPGSEDC